MNDNLDIHAYADNQLDAQTRAQIEAALAENGSLKREYDDICQMKQLVSKLETEDCSALWKKCSGRLDEIDRASRVQRFVSKNAWSLCAVFAIAIIGAGVMNRIKPTQVTASDAAYAASSIPLGSGGQRTLERLPLPEEQRMVDGGRSQMNDGVGIERYEFIDNSGRFTLVRAVGAQVTGCHDLGEGFAQTMCNSLPAIVWADGADSWIVIANRDVESLRALAAELRQRL